MRELSELVFSVCVVLVGVEVLAQLFPEKSGSLVHGLAVLLIVVSLINGVLHLDFDLPAVSGTFEVQTQAQSPSYAETGTALLRKRLYAILNTAGVAVRDGVDGIAVWYTQDDSGAVTIDRVRVCVEFGSDVDRAASLMRSVLTDAIRVDVFTS